MLLLLALLSVPSLPHVYYHAMHLAFKNLFLAKWMPFKSIKSQEVSSTAKKKKKKARLRSTEHLNRASPLCESCPLQSANSREVGCRSEKKGSLKGSFFEIFLGSIPFFFNLIFLFFFFIIELLVLGQCHLFEGGAVHKGNGLPWLFSWNNIGICPEMELSPLHHLEGKGRERCL